MKSKTERRIQRFLGHAIVIVSISNSSLATPPCAPDYSTLCRAIGGVWTSAADKCETGGSCSKLLPLVQVECRVDSDCVACGSSECKPNIQQFSNSDLEALRREPSIGWEYYSSCSPPLNQLCGCKNQRCVVTSPSVDCRSDADCYYCCGICQSTLLKTVMDCKTMCILDSTKEFGCRCDGNSCKRAQ